MYHHYITNGNELSRFVGREREEGGKKRRGGGEGEEKSESTLTSPGPGRGVRQIGKGIDVSLLALFLTVSLYSLSRACCTV
jgi:hypothetical protein